MLLLKWEQDTIPSPLVSQSVSHLGNRWGLWETARLQFPMQAAGVVEALLTLMGQGMCVWGVGVHVPGELWAHHISLELLLYTCNVWFTWGKTHTHTHTHTQRRGLLLLSVHMPLWPLH